jgi:pyridoxal phosphate enzyme (YggS family)
VAQLITGLTAERVRANLDEVRDEVAQAAARAGRAADGVEILAAVKYVALEELGAIAGAGITTVGENRAQELERKAVAQPELTWDFIGQLQSRKVKAIVPLVRRIHSIASDSALEQLIKHDRQGLEAFLQVNIADEEGKAGVAPDEVPAYLERWRFSGLMVMPPLAATPEHNRRWFAAARELADRHGLDHLSMGTTQDFGVAVEEGATVVRVGSRLYR